MRHVSVPSRMEEAAMAEEERLGEVIHYFDRIQVAVLRLARGVKQGQRVHFKGAHTDFEQELTSLQVDHQVVSEAPAKGEVAVKVVEKVRRGDDIFRLA